MYHHHLRRNPDLKGEELLQELARTAPQAAVRPDAVRHHRRLRRKHSSKRRMQLLQKLSRRGRAHIQQHSRLHQRNRGHALFTATEHRSAQREAEEDIQNPTDPDADGMQKAYAQRQSSILKEALHESDRAVHNNDQERSMLETSTLSSSQTMFVLKRLKLTVQRMRAQIDALDYHKNVCRKSIADLTNGQNKRADDTTSANFVQVED